MHVGMNNENANSVKDILKQKKKQQQQQQIKQVDKYVWNLAAPDRFMGNIKASIALRPNGRKKEQPSNQGQRSKTPQSRAAQQDGAISLIFPNLNSQTPRTIWIPKF